MCFVRLWVFFLLYRRIRWFACGPFFISPYSYSTRRQYAAELNYRRKRVVFVGAQSRQEDVNDVTRVAPLSRELILETWCEISNKLHFCTKSSPQGNCIAWAYNETVRANLWFDLKFAPADIMQMWRCYFKLNCVSTFANKSVTLCQLKYYRALS